MGCRTPLMGRASRVYFCITNYAKNWQLKTTNIYYLKVSEGEEWLTVVVARWFKPLISCNQAVGQGCRQLRADCGWKISFQDGSSQEPSVPHWLLSGGFRFRFLPHGCLHRPTTNVHLLRTSNNSVFILSYYFHWDTFLNIISTYGCQM